MEALKVVRKNAKASFSRNISWLDRNLENCTDEFKIISRKTSLIDAFDKYENAQYQIENILEEQGLDIESETVQHDSFCETYIDYIAMVEKKIHSLSNIHPKANSQILPLNTTSNMVNPTNVKLPQLQVPTFSGEMSKWTAFYDLFTSLIVNNNSLSDVEKLMYLKTALKGEALTLIDSLELTNENFAIGLNILRGR